MGKVDDEFMILLNIDRIFTTDELVMVQEVGDKDRREEADAASLAQE